MPVQIGRPVAEIPNFFPGSSLAVGAYNHSQEREREKREGGGGGGGAAEGGGNPGGMKGLLILQFTAVTSASHRGLERLVPSASKIGHRVHLEQHDDC